MTVYKHTKGIVKINKDRLKILANDVVFIKKIASIRRDFNINKDGLNKESDIEDWYKKLYVDYKKTALFNKKVRELLILAKLPDNFSWTMEGYIIRGKFVRIPATNYALNTSNNNISIVLYRKPTKEEWIDIKNLSNRFLNLAAEKKYKFMDDMNYPDGAKILKPKKTLDRDLHAMSLKKEGYSLAEIEANIFEDDGVNVINTKQSKKNVKKIKIQMDRLKKRGVH